MRQAMKWTLPVMAALAMFFSMAILSAKAEDTATDKGTITGTVTQDGKPAANIAVRLMKPAAPATAPAAQADEPPKAKKGGGGGGGRGTVVANATTDDQGKFSFPNVEPGDYTVAAGARGQAMGRSKVTVEAGKTADVAITLMQRAGGGGGGAAK